MKTSDQERAAYEKLVCEHWHRSVLLRRNQPGHSRDGAFARRGVPEAGNSMGLGNLMLIAEAMYLMVITRA